MKDFVVGLLLGLLAMYWYLTQGDTIRMAVESMWARASSAPPVARRAH